MYTASVPSVLLCYRADREQAVLGADPSHVAGGEGSTFLPRRHGRA